MVDVKKLTVGFLILATISGSFAFAFSIFSTSNASPAADEAADATTTNAFTEPLPNDATTNAIQAAENQFKLDDYLPPVASSTNLTETFAHTFLVQSLALNPGVFSGQDAASGLTPPPASSLTADLSQSAGMKDFQIPDWDAEWQNLPLQIAPNSQQATADYEKGLGGIFAAYFSNPSFSASISSGSASNDEILKNIEAGRGALAELAVPEQFVNFHKSLLQLLTYEKDGLELVGEAQTDPFRASLVFQAKDDAFQLALQRFNSEIDALRQQTSEKGGGSVFATVFDSLFGVKKAHAFLGVGDVVFDPITEAETTATVLQIIWQEVKKVLLQLLKNLLVALIQNTILSYVQNGGAPRFIQDFALQAFNSYNNSVQQSFAKMAPQFCPNFGALSLSTLNAQFNFNPLGHYGTMCTLTDLVGNVKDFYNDFQSSNAGWYNYTINTQPQNDLFMSLYMAKVTADENGNNQQNADQTHALATNGYLSVEECPGNSKPVSSMCPDGSHAQVVTPGKAISDMLQNGTAANMHLIVNADDIIGLAGTIAVSLLTNVITKNLASAPQSTVPPGPPPPPPPPPTPVVCSPTTQTVASGTLVVFMASNGTAPYTWSAPDGTPTNGTGLSFSTVFMATGNTLVTVADSIGQNANCFVTVK